MILHFFFWLDSHLWFGGWPGVDLGHLGSPPHGLSLTDLVLMSEAGCSHVIERVPNSSKGLDSQLYNITGDEFSWLIIRWSPGSEYLVLPSYRKMSMDTGKSLIGTNSESNLAHSPRITSSIHEHRQRQQL